MLGVYLHFSSPRHQSQLLFGEQSRYLIGCIPHYTTSKESQKRVTSLRCIKASASYLFSFCFLSNSCIELSLTMAACASCASLMKWFRTLRSQIGLSGVGRLGWVHSNTINRKASNPAIPDAKKGVSDWWNNGDKEQKSSRSRKSHSSVAGLPETSDTKEDQVARTENRNLSSIINPAMVLWPHINKHLPNTDVTSLHLATKERQTKLHLNLVWQNVMLRYLC